MLKALFVLEKFTIYNLHLHLRPTFWLFNKKKWLDRKAENSLRIYDVTK